MPESENSELEILEDELKQIQEAIANAKEAIQGTEKKLLSVSLEKEDGERILEVLKQHLTFQISEAKRVKEKIKNLSK